MIVHEELSPILFMYLSAFTILNNQQYIHYQHCNVLTLFKQISQGHKLVTLRQIKHSERKPCIVFSCLTKTEIRY